MDGSNLKFYHKKGGNVKYYSPVEYAIRWDRQSKSNYKSYKKIIPYMKKQGFIISGRGIMNRS